MSSVMKNPPVLENIEDYEQWKEDVLIWKEVTDMGKKKQALAVHLTLKGRAKEVANRVPTEDKKKDDGLETLLAKLDEAFLKEPERRRFMAYRDFEKCIRKEGVTICEFMGEFDAKYFKMTEKKMVLPDEVLAFRLVENCRLTKVEMNQVMASTKPLSFVEVRATLKRMFESGGDTDKCNEGEHGVRVKEEPVYVTKTRDSGSREVESGAENNDGKIQEEDVMWTTNNGNPRGYGRSWSRRYYRGGRYPRRYWQARQTGIGCYVCGSKDHLARDCEKRWQEKDNKDSKDNEEI